MKKDIEVRKVENLIIAIAPRTPDEEGYEDFWDAYLINLEEEPIKSVMVVSKGYGEINGDMRTTATLRHFWPEVGPMDAIKIEPIQSEVFELAQEFWVSFSYEDYLYDKKYVFVPGSIDTNHFTDVPFIDRRGVMIR
jgi:hypothetical protein